MSRSKVSREQRKKNAQRKRSKNVRTTLVWEPEHLQQTGPLLLGVLSLPDTLANLRSADALPEVNEVGGALLVDTGATQTCISMRAADKLGLMPRRISKSYGSGGATEHPVFFVRLTVTIVNDGRKVSLVAEREMQGIPDLHVPFERSGLKLRGQQVEVVGLLGRDLLRHAVLTYNGVRGTVEVEFDLKSLGIETG